MRLCCFNDRRVGGLRDDRVVDLGRLLPAEVRGRPQAAVVHLMGHWADVGPLCAALVAEERGFPLSAVRLRAPLPEPSKIVAAPVNYTEHRDEVDWTPTRYEHTVEDLAFFLKAPSSVIGPDGTVLLPFPDVRTDYEGELAVVIGHTARRVSPAGALDHVFGYCCLLDMTVREPFSHERSTRKSYDTFTPIGPWIATADEVGDPQRLRLRTWLNDELRQDASTSQMIVDVAGLVARASAIMTLHPGDLIATGTPAGVGQVRPGDRVTVDIDRVGRMTVAVGEVD